MRVLSPRACAPRRAGSHNRALPRIHGTRRIRCAFTDEHSDTQPWHVERVTARNHVGELDAVADRRANLFALGDCCGNDVAHAAGDADVRRDGDADGHSVADDSGDADGNADGDAGGGADGNGDAYLDGLADDSSDAKQLTGTYARECVGGGSPSARPSTYVEGAGACFSARACVVAMGHLPTRPLLRPTALHLCGALTYLALIRTVGGHSYGACLAALSSHGRGAPRASAASHVRFPVPRDVPLN